MKNTYIEPWNLKQVYNEELKDSDKKINLDKIKAYAKRFKKERRLTPGEESILLMLNIEDL